MPEARLVGTYHTVYNILHAQFVCEHTKEHKIPHFQCLVHACRHKAYFRFLLYWSLKNPTDHCSSRQRRFRKAWCKFWWNYHDGGGMGQYSKHPHSRHRAQLICNICSKEALTRTLQRKVQWATLIAGYKEYDQFSSPSADFCWLFKFLEQKWSIRAPEESGDASRTQYPGPAAFPSKQSG